MSLSNIQLERYSRNILVKEIGLEGQKKLLNSKVMIIGAGGLGSPAALYLASAGVGTIGIVDYDKIDLSNLQRQILHSTSKIGELKSESAKESLISLNPDLNIITHNKLVSEKNILNLIKDYDFILDCTDNIQSKFLINDACVILKKPFTHAGVIRFNGQLMTVIPGESPCYRCIFQDVPNENSVQTCKQVGVIGAAVGVIGSLQALEAIKYLTSTGELLTGNLLTFDALTMNFRKIKLPKRNHNCKVCGENPSINLQNLFDNKISLLLKSNLE